MKVAHTQTVDMHALARAVRDSNPFVSNRVTQADDLAVDVPSIHGSEFKSLIKRIEQVRKTGGATGVLLVGAAGIGKSHLLSRLFRWAAEGGRATMVYLHNVLASPERLPRYVLRATVSTLAGYRAGDYPHSQLYALINRSIAPVLDEVRGGKKAPSVPSMTDRVSALRKIAREVDPEGLVMPVFIAFLAQAVDACHGDRQAETRAVAAVQWLSGETIESEIAEAIGIECNTEEGAVIPDDEAVQRVLDVICRLCGKAGRPFILCVDQVDNLDAEKVTALTSFLHTCLDNGRNLTIITSGVKQSIMSLEREGIIPQASWDRLAQYKIEIARVEPSEARLLVEERIRDFMRPFKAVREVAMLVNEDPVFPLGKGWLDERLEAVIDVRPRDIVSWARDRWDQEQELIEEFGEAGWIEQVRNKGRRERTGGPRPQPRLDLAIDALVSKKVQQATLDRALHPERLPPDADNLATLALELLKRCVGHQSYTLRDIERVVSRKGAVTYDLRAAEVAPGGRATTSGLAFLTPTTANAGTWCLKRMLDGSKPPTHQLLVTDEERRPLKLGTKGREHYDALTKREGFEHLKLSAANYAELDALSVVLGSARVGDLELDRSGEPRPISEPECLESLHRQNYFLGHPLLRELLTEEARPPTSPPPPPPPGEQVVRERMVAELRWRLGMTGREMTRILIERERLKAEDFEQLWGLVRDVAKTLFAEGHVFATAQDDDLFLQFRKKVAS